MPPAPKLRAKPLPPSFQNFNMKKVENTISVCGYSNNQRSTECHTSNNGSHSNFSDFISQENSISSRLNEPSGPKSFSGKTQNNNQSLFQGRNQPMAKSNK